MTKKEKIDQNNHSSYNKLYALINEDINKKSNEDIKVINNKSMRQINPIKSNNFIQLEDKDKHSKNIDDKNIVQLRPYNKISSLKMPKTELLPNNRRDMIKKFLIDNNEEQKNNDENIISSTNKVLVKPKEYKGTKSEDKIFYPLTNYKIEPIINDSKYNYFFILVIPQKLMNSIKISIYDKKSFKTEEMNVQSYYILYKFSFLSESKGKKLDEDLNYILVQVPVRKDTNTLITMIEINETQETYIGDIRTSTYKDNYFYPQNVFYAMKMYDLTINQIFEIYLNYFFAENKTNDEILKSDLILSLIEHIKNSFRNIELTGDVILKFLNYSFLYEHQPDDLMSIKVKKSPNLINKDIYIKYEDLNKYEISKKAKTEIMYLLIQIYTLNDKDYLMSLLKGNLGYKYFGCILFLIKNKILNIYDLIFPNEDDNLFLQDNLLQYAEDVKDINSVLSLSFELTKCLKYLNKNYEKIYTIFGSKNKYENKKLDLPRINKDTNYKDIYDSLIILIKTNEKYKHGIIDFDKIFIQLMNYYYNGTLEEFENLNGLLEILESKDLITFDLIKTYRIYLHKKGIRLIQEGMLDIKTIMDFIFNKDIFFYHKKYKKYSEPGIFRFIPITTKNENYEINIQEMKKYKVWKLFDESDKKIHFYEALLEQITRIMELRHIFELIPEDEFDKIFAALIKNKMKEISDTISIEKPENYDNIFEILKLYLLCLENNNISLYIPEINYEFNFRFFKYILQEKSLKNIVKELYQEIITFFIELNINKIGIEEDIIEILLISIDNDLSIKMLDNMEKLVIKKDDFYYKDETRNYYFFKLFYQKCQLLLNNKKGKYVKETLKKREEIFDELNDLKVVFNKINDLCDEDNSLYNRLLLISDNEELVQELNNKIKEAIQICRDKISIFEKIEEFYNTFFSTSKREEINLIRYTLTRLKMTKLNELIKLKEKNIIKNNESFDFDASFKDSQNLKYKYSLFFMAIYKVINMNEYLFNSENEIFNKSEKAYKDTIIQIILQKDKKSPFFEIPYINEIMKIISNRNNNLQEEINFIEKEFINLKKNEYIKNGLLEDLINFSNKNKIYRLILGIIYLIKSYQKIVKINLTNFTKELENQLQILDNKNISGPEIKQINNYLLNLNYDINQESSIINFYRIFMGKEEALIFIKTLKESNLEIRNLNEFIDENENSQLQVNDIDNLLDVYTFFEKLIKDESIETDQDFHNKFQKNFFETKYLPIKLQGYLSCYGEIIQLYQLYGENSEMTVQKIFNLLNESEIKIFEEDNGIFSFEIFYVNQKKENVKLIPTELDELKNKLLISSTNSSKIKSDGKADKEKKDLTNDFINLLDSIIELIDTLNNLIKVGYPYIINLTLNVRNSIAQNKIDKKPLREIITGYKTIIKDYKSLVKKGYTNFPLMRFFYGKQLIKLYKKIKISENNKNSNDVSHLINSVALKEINNFQIKFEFDDSKDIIENINNYLDNLFQTNKINIDDILSINNVLLDSQLTPGLYKYEKKFDNSELIVNIINLYINLTGNSPIVDTLLICNEETPIEKIIAFLYKAIYCKKPILFTIAHLECLELSITQNIIKTLIYLFNKKNRIMESYLLILFQEKNSGLGRELKKIISDKKILNSYFFKEPSKMPNIFNETHLFSSKYAGYGKSTQIKLDIKFKKGIYNYLPIGGAFSRDYVIQNLLNLNLKLDKKVNCLHIDLSETEDDDLMNEILFKLIILRCVDSKENVFYLGYNIKIYIEIPSGFIDFLEKYKILNLFKKTHIETLPPLLLEEDAFYIYQSPISIVAETLDYYEKNIIRTRNIDLMKPIEKSSYECEEIINRYFKGKNNNYYQKMNFIKILSVQFVKFCNNIYFSPENINPNNREIIENARKVVIKNFILLTKVFACSPYDNILLGQAESLKFMDKSNKLNIKENVLLSLAKDKKEIFSFEKIKPSLVFFNKDGQSLSIISNCNKSDKEYQDLKALWNSQNYGNNNNSDLTDYKSLSHDEFLKEIKNLFSLDKMSIDELKLLCESSGHYIFVSDNYIKMVRILLNIEAKIPTILMGETGVGKTKLMEILSTLYGNGKSKWKILQIHAGITDQDIVNFIDKITEESKIENTENEYTWIFLDEINTCNSLGLITEIMCHHTYLGKKINDNFIFIGACNPYRLLTKKMRESGLVYYNMQDTTKLNNLVYTVNPLPHSLLNFVFDFGNLRFSDEQKYISNAIKSIISEIQEQNLIPGMEVGNLNNITEIVIKTVLICHEFICEIYDISSVSMREIRRFGIFFTFFIRYFGNEKNMTNIIDSYQKMLYSLNISLYLCYYLRLNDKNARNKLVKDLNDYFPNKNFIKFPESEIKKITEQMYIEKSKGIALNRALRENLFTIFMCITNNVPLIIVGKPGTSKSLSFQILYNTMKGEYSESDFFKDKGKLYRYYYQGSEASTSKGIEKVFSKAIKAQANNKNKNIISLVFFDEMGLAERSSNNPLKIIHYLLEKDNENSVPFLGISNWKLDASKINRALSLTITDYDVEDLEETAIAIAEALDNELCDRYKDFFEILAQTYFEYVQYNQNNKLENKDFHGNRDFYNLIKNSMSELINANKVLGEKKFSKKEKKYLTDIGLTCLERNFGGLEDSTKIIMDIFKNKFEYKYDDSYYIKNKKTIVDIVKKNILDPNGRYLMLISEGNDASNIIKYVLKSMKKNYIELVGSRYKNDIKSGRYSEEILNKIKYIMETDNILILRDLDIIYPSLFDLFNQNFTCMGDKKFARIAFEYAKISSEVNPNFRVIIIVNHLKIEELKLDPPFLNRFEKHIINFGMLLDEKDLEISNKILKYLELIFTYNNNKKLKLDLEKIMINCQKNSIEGLIYKIKTEESITNKSKIIQKIFEIIVPTFCQDIIASIISSKMDKKYQDFNDMVLNIYQSEKCINFEKFFEKINSRKNIIYTFSKITEEVFNENNEKLKNKYGEFTKETTEIVMIESIKSENDLSFLLKSFTNSSNKLLILKFSESDISKINLFDHIINNFEKEYGELKEKIILFIIHRQRYLKSSLNSKKKKSVPEFIPFINDDYYQIFIDNLQGKELYDITQMKKDKKEAILKDFIEKTYFLDNNLFTVLNYIKFNILNETEEINNKNIISILSKKIFENLELKKLLKQNIQIQSDGLKDIINEVFLTNAIEVNDVDFFEVIHSILIMNFSKFLLKIIYHLLKQHLLLQIVDKDEYNNLNNNNFFSELISEELNKKVFNFVPQLKPVINGNQIIIYNGLQIPESKLFLERINVYINNEIFNRYVENEDSLRKKYFTDEEINKAKDIYKNEIDQLNDNIRVEIEKYEFYKNIFKNKDSYPKKLFNDYLIFFIIKYLEKNAIDDFTINKKILSFLILIIKLKLKYSEEKKKFNKPIENFKFKYTEEEFINILIFTQGYKNDLFTLFNIYIQILKYFPNIEESLTWILNSNIIKYEISERNKEYAKIVNLLLFNIIEALSRAILQYSIDLIHSNKNKFYEFFNIFTSIETNLQNLNNKYILFNKELYNIGSIIKIKDSYKYNLEQFEINYEKILDNLLNQSICLYENDLNNLYNIIFELNIIFNETFQDKNDEYINLMFYIFLRQYEIVNDEKIKMKLIKNILNDPLLIPHSKIFLYDTLCPLRPEICDKNENNPELIEQHVNNFMNLKSGKVTKYKNLYDIYNKINSNELDEIILYICETQCQEYFKNIYNLYGNQYNEETCEAILLNTSLRYLSKAIKYLKDVETNEKGNLNKILKFLAIAYIKTYIHFYVEINLGFSNAINFNNIKDAFEYKIAQDKIFKNTYIIYIWKKYCKKFENFNKFESFDFSKKKIPMQKEIFKKLEEEEKISQFSNYIFKESFIPINYQVQYSALAGNPLEPIFNFEEINKNFDILYCFLVNKIISHLYSNNKAIFSTKMKTLYLTTNKRINFNQSGVQLYKNLLYNLEDSIFSKIADNPLNQIDCEILLYSLRFVFSTQMNKENNFYNNLLSQKSYIFINNNYIPGSFPFINEFIKSYNDLEEKFKKVIQNGYYICKDCGYLYEVPPCTLPYSEGKCPNGHPIGGLNHICTKKDIRVFPNKQSMTKYNLNKSFESLTLAEYKSKYVDQYLKQKPKGIIKGYRFNDFERNDYVNDVHIITYRLLNFILYSYLISAFILNSLIEKEMRDFLIENLFPHTLFGIIKKGWELLDKELKAIGFKNIQVFLNMTFDNISKFINNLQSVDNLDKLNNFEKEVNDYILSIIENRKKISEINKEYNEYNNQASNINFGMLKELLQQNFDPLLYSEKIPDLKFYCISNIYDLNTFTKIFNSNKENKNKYALINALINIDSDLIKNAKKMKYLKHINKLANLLLNIYSYKISRENAKVKTLQEELSNIINNLNEINKQKQWTEQTFIDEYVVPFKKSWDEIKNKSVQYKCRILRDLDRGEKPLDIDINNTLNYFLVDDGDKEGGMFLASAYSNFIEWQNQFIDDIISKNNMTGILNSYVSQLEKEINVQDATESEILNIDEQIYSYLNELISLCSMRNIFSKNDKKINYQKYNDIIYNFDLIEEELGKRLIPYLKKFKKDKIKFVTYFYEGFRGKNSTVLIDFNAKYTQRELTEDEKNYINKVLKINNNSNFINDIFSSLQILMNEILKENYNQNYLLYDIIEKLPKYIILNEQLIKLIKDRYIEHKEQSFIINSLFSIFEYFEDLCWDEIQKNIPIDYMLELPKSVKTIIYNYFNTISLEKKIITRFNLSEALRKLISRSIAGSRQEIDIKSDLELKLYISREDLWIQDILNEDSFIEEVDKIFNPEILVGHCFCMYKLLKNNDINIDEILKEEKENKNNQENEDKDDINKDEELNLDKKSDKKEKEKNNLDESEFSHKSLLKIDSVSNKEKEDEEEEEEMNLYPKNANNKNKINQINTNSRNEINIQTKNQNSERKDLLDNNLNTFDFNKNIEQNGISPNFNNIILYGKQALRGSIISNNENENARNNNNIKRNKSVKEKIICDKCDKCKCKYNCFIF